MLDVLNRPQYNPISVLDNDFDFGLLTRGDNVCNHIIFHFIRCRVVPTNPHVARKFVHTLLRGVVNDNFVKEPTRSVTPIVMLNHQSLEIAETRSLYHKLVDAEKVLIRYTQMMKRENSLVLNCHLPLSTLANRNKAVIAFKNIH